MRLLVIDLWKRGNGRLNVCLANGGATSVDLSDEKWDTTSRYPEMLSELRHLRHLSIACSGWRLQNPYHVSTSLRHLSPTLETLKLDFKDAPACLREYTFRPSHHDPSLVIPIAGPVWNVGGVLPNLKTLTMPGECHFTSSDLDSLPSGLTSLSLAWSDVDDLVTSHLPRNLLDLDLHQGTELFSTSDFATLPPTLTRLHCYSRLPSLDILKYLPRSMTEIGPEFASLVARI